MERLHKYLARCGVASRRQAEQMILAGKIKVNGQIISQLGRQIDPAKDLITVQGKQVIPKPSHTYLLLYKPAGVVTTCKDPQNRKTVLDLLPAKGRLFPVGRLDYETEGLLLLTDDGDLANRLMHPRYKITKTYVVETDEFLSEEKLQQLQQGVTLEDGPTQPAKVKRMFCRGKGSRFSLTITEGRNRQVRRMCGALGLTVISLCRTQIGFLTLAGLPVGGFRLLRPQEVRQLKRLCDTGCTRD